MAAWRLILRHVSGLKSINFNLNADSSCDCPRGLMSTSATQQGYKRPEAEKHQANLFPKLSHLCICAARGLDIDWRMLCYDSFEQK
jgi:hypothetical protein